MCSRQPESKSRTTWDEWLAAVEKLTTDGQYGIGLPANKQLYTDQTVYDFMINAGADEIYNSDGTLRFNNPQTVEAFDMYSKLYKFSPADSPDWMWGEAEACFANRTARWSCSSRSLPPTTRRPRAIAEDLGVAPIPYKDGVENPGTISYVNAAMILTDDPAKQEASKKFLSFLLEPENYGRFINAEPGLYLPVTEDGSTPRRATGTTR